MDGNILCAQEEVEHNGAYIQLLEEDTLVARLMRPKLDWIEYNECETKWRTTSTACREETYSDGKALAFWPSNRLRLQLGD